MRDFRCEALINQLYGKKEAVSNASPINFYNLKY
jgi:hypothetical protein